jgi:hypothetical protein
MESLTKFWQPLRFPHELEAAMERSRRLIAAAHEQASITRELRATSADLRQTNRDFRELLREQRLGRLRV